MLKQYNVDTALAVVLL